MQRAFISAVVGVMLTGVLTATSARAASIAQHSGNTDPTTEGFVDNLGNPPAPGSPSGSAWNISGSWCCTYANHLLMKAELNELNSAANWTLTATFNNLSADTGPGFLGPDAAGTYVTIQTGATRIDLDIHADGLGDQVLSLDPFTGAADPTIAGLGTSYATFTLIYDNTTKLGNVFVNRVEVISDYAGHSNCGGCGNAASVGFGGEDADFTNVELLTPTPRSVPEPAGIAVLSVGVDLIWRCRPGRRRGTGPGARTRA